MSWLKKFWRGEARFWQAFWFGAALVILSTLALGVYVGQSIESGAMSFNEFYHISGYFQTAVLVFCAVWLLALTRGLHLSTLKWSAWLGVAVVVYLIGTSTYNLTLYVLRDGNLPTAFMQDGEGL